MPAGGEFACALPLGAVALVLASSCQFVSSRSHRSKLRRWMRSTLPWPYPPWPKLPTRAGPRAIIAPSRRMNRPWRLVCRTQATRDVALHRWQGRSLDYPPRPYRRCTWRMTMARWTMLVCHNKCCQQRPFRWWPALISILTMPMPSTGTMDWMRRCWPLTPYRPWTSICSNLRVSWRGP